MMSGQKRFDLKGTLATALIVAVFFNMAAVLGGNAPGEAEKFKADTRGFGSVAVTLRQVGEKKDASWTTFVAQDAEHARIIASKRMADLLGFGDIKPASVSGLPGGTVLELANTGWWLLGIEGANFHELFFPDKNVLAQLSKDCNAASWQPVPEKAYPRWLDCFDNAGPGIWWGGGGSPVDIDSEFPWMKERGLTYNFHPPSERRYVAPGVLDTTLTDWFGVMAKRFDIPFRTNLWESKPTWLWNREPLPYVRRALGYQAATIYFAGQSLYSIPYGAEPVSISDPYSQDFRRRFMSSMKSDPNFMGSMAVAEIPDVGVRELAAVAEMPETLAYWRSYLVHVVGLDLPKLGLMHHGRRDFYRSWDEVRVPLPRDFLGFDAQSVDLAGVWEGQADRGMKGAEARWFAPETMPKEGWVPVNSNDPMLLLNIGGQHCKEKRADYWLKRSVAFMENQLPNLKYLHVARPALRSKYCDAYVNGKVLKQVTKDQYEDLSVCFELGDVLHSGENQFVLHFEGYAPAGFITLSSMPLRTYPHMTPPENRRWFDAFNFSSWLRLRGVEQTLQAMRSAEPNRPLKMMALIQHLDQSTELCERYGAYQHDTGGASAYWCPMTGARLSSSHGLPWSCEQSGAPRDAAIIQKQITFNIMYGNDALDMVFATNPYKNNPEVAPWFDRNLELIRCIGKMHLPTPPIGVLRSTRASRLGFGEPWNWDVGRGALQETGRNFAYVEVPDILNGIIDQYPVVMDAGTVLLTDEDIEGIRRYVERGGIFVAQHHTGRHAPEQADAWALAHSFGLSVTPKWMSDENFNRWSHAKITFAKGQDLLPSLRGRTIAGSGVAIDYLGKEHSGAVSYTPNNQKDKGIRPIATWEEDGSMAIAEVRLGRGRLILLGTPFITRMMDNNGVWMNREERIALLDEFLAALGVPRDSWTGAKEIWAEIWRSKNGVFDLYKMARMTKAGEEKLAAEISLRREAPVSELVEVSALGHPKVKVAWKDGRMTLPAAEYGLMQSRVFIAPRPGIARSGIDWFRTQSQIWRALPPIPAVAKPVPIPVPDDIIPAADEWRLAPAGIDASWTQTEFADSNWKMVKLGTFATLGIPEDAAAQFRKTIDIPKAWQGRRINLCFSAEWSYGVVPQGHLFIDGQPAGVKQPLAAMGDTSFTLDVTEQAKDGKLVLALEVDGAKGDKTKLRSRPSGVTGIFFLEAVPPAVANTSLSGPWFAAGDVNVLAPVAAGEKATYTYLETRFTLPKDWPARRVFLESPVKLQYLIINDQVINAPMNSLDVSGLLRRDGENVLRWIPNQNAPEITKEHKGPVPELNLVWKE
ncbi:MAG: hypothetical protein WAX69_05915 [Victivallales bacterium]